MGRTAGAIAADCCLCCVYTHLEPFQVQVFCMLVSAYTTASRQSLGRPFNWALVVVGGVGWLDQQGVRSTRCEACFRSGMFRAMPGMSNAWIASAVCVWHCLAAFMCSSLLWGCDPPLVGRTRPTTQGQMCRGTVHDLRMAAAKGPHKGPATGKQCMRCQLPFFSIIAAPYESPTFLFRALHQ